VGPRQRAVDEAFAVMAVWAAVMFTLEGAWPTGLIFVALAAFFRWYR